MEQTMTGHDYGQREPMENEAMVRTLETQARAIWPQERAVFRGVFHRSGLEVIDVGCGTGEIASRIMRQFLPERVIGIDLSESHIERAQKRFGNIPGLSFQRGDAMAMSFEDDRFDVAVCRHMLQAIPKPLAVIREMVRVVREGGVVVRSCRGLRDVVVPSDAVRYG